MPRGASKRVLSNIDELTSVPPSPPLPSSRTIARVSQAQGKNLFHCVLPHGDTILAELAPIFRGKAWIRRGGYVMVDTAVFEGRPNKIGGEIVNVVRNEKDWRKMNYWPTEFAQKMEAETDCEEESTAGNLPPRFDNEE